jgi:hypothetical protein
LRGAIGNGKRLMVGFRGEYRSIRDIYLLEAAGGADRFVAVPVSDDHWQLDICPMAGPFVQSASHSNQVLISWMSRGAVYRASSNDGGQTFGPRLAPMGGHRSPASSPIVLSNARGQFLFGWVEGQSVRFECISPDGRIQASGENGRLPSNSRLTGFVDQDGSFALVY